MRGRLKYDDSLDVFSVHGLGGMWVAIATGIFATGTVANGVKGAFYGNWAQLGVRLLSVVAAVLIAVVGAVVCFTKLLTGNRVKALDAEQGSGLDLSQHGEQLESNA